MLNITQQFEQAIADGPAAFNSAMLGLMSTSAAFRRSVEFRSPGWRDKARAYIEQKTSDYPLENPDLLRVTSAIFNQELPYYLKKTANGQTRRMIEDGKRAAISYAKLPVSERRRFIQIFKDKIHMHAEKIRLSIISDMGTYKGEVLKVDEYFDSALNTAEIVDGEVERKSVVYIQEFCDEPYELAMRAMVSMLAFGKAVVVSPNIKAPDWVFHVMDAGQPPFRSPGLIGNLPPVVAA